MSNKEYIVVDSDAYGKPHIVEVDRKRHKRVVVASLYDMRGLWDDRKKAEGHVQYLVEEKLKRMRDAIVRLEKEGGKE